MKGLINSVVKPLPKVGQEPNQKDIEDFLRQSFPVKPGDTLKIVHLWEKNYRIKVYKRYKSGNSVMSFDKLVESKFVQVRVKNDILSYKVL